MSDELIRKNPCDSVDIVIPSNRKSERKALILADYQDIISHLESLTGKEKRFYDLKRKGIDAYHWLEGYNFAAHRGEFND